MVEKSIVPLQRVYVHFHLPCRPVDILTVPCRPEGLCLQRGNHIHVVYPQACLGRVSVFEKSTLLLQGKVSVPSHARAAFTFRILPLVVRISQTHLQCPFISVQQVDFQGNGSENGKIHMVVTIA